MIFRLVLLAISTCLFSLVLKETFKPVALLLTVAATVAFFLIFSKVISAIKDDMGAFESISNFDAEGIAIIFKTLMIAYLTSFGSDICLDAGERAIANALESAGKAIMLSMAFPILRGIFESVRDILGG